MKLTVLFLIVKCDDDGWDYMTLYYKLPGGELTEIENSAAGDDNYANIVKYMSKFKQNGFTNFDVKVINTDGTIENVDSSEFYEEEE